ncbi:DUF192 domain-containing protein [Myxococcus sp. MISCRS1]|jgi:hypothetical protein|uniref:DUF192 domain-containing protein n=1 Tax=Myxococcus TaxID=32 RepID=UPI0011438509|nr:MULTISPECIES: DUF192 domain-containing protein [Myxococcus]MBZ4412967.1 DUF192 domain-containing protein [Myxococcus sp. XM-1-1-1]MCK8501200.1 DUF192 domain-containing protein [Myxococcus fulvus]MCY0997202.1 DUF192 domain-containing protein [Myxococcus sp. MISCRS1]BDT32782.1 DUF192 domain-containing protein [Myxococcus sp. MH1]
MRWKVTNETRQRPLADRAEKATSFAHRFKGLMGRTELAVGEGLHIQPCNSIHTFFMRIPIDVAFLDAQGRIVKQMMALPPWRATSVYLQARSVLELPAGVLAASGTQEGDRLSFEPASSAPMSPG